MKTPSRLLFSPFISFFLLIFIMLFAFSANAQSVSENVGTTLQLDLEDLIEEWSEAPKAIQGIESENPVFIMLPMPDGSERQMRIEKNSLMSPEFAAEFPEIQTYDLIAADNEQITGHATLSPNGLLVNLRTPEGMVEIHPVDMTAPTLHRVSMGENILYDQTCGFDVDFKTEIEEESRFTFTNGATQRTYDFAIVTTGEYGQTHGGTVAAATAIVTQMVGALEDIYEKELAVKFNLLTPVIYLDPANDPFPTANSNRTLMAGEAVALNWPNSADYDIGHVLHSTGGGSWGGGVAFFGLCNNGVIFGSTTGNALYKGGAWSSVGTSPTGAVGLFAHEVGHQFYMNHTFNGTNTFPVPNPLPNPCNESCTCNIAKSDSYEIGSGTTIMSYNGLCQANNNIPSPGAIDDYFHTNSLDEAVARMMSTSCETSATSGNQPPTVNANPCGANTTIPKSTPFRLTGSGTDPDGDQIFYSWEQYDEDGVNVNPTQGYIGATAGGSTLAPLFRSYPPTTDPQRYFPNQQLVANNDYSSSFEALPSVARTINFRLTGRDNKTAGGGIHCAALAITVSAQGPLAVLAPNGGETLTAGNTTTVTWNLNGITFLTNVNIKMSIDGGLSFPYTLAANTPAADGSETVTIPAGTPNTTTARIMVESADADCIVFYDISNGDFTINSACNAPATLISPDAPVTFAAGDPGLNLGLMNNIGAVVTNFAGSVTTGDTPGNLIFLDNSPPVCAGPSNSNYLDTYNFSVDMTGSYTIAHGGPFGTVINLYAAPYSGSNCTNHISSNAVRPTGTGPISLNANLTATLTAGVSYVLVVSSFSTTFPTLPAAYNVTFPTTPAGANVYDGVILPANYSYTYVAVNTTNDQVALVDVNSNFTALAAGSYKVYGAAYYSGGTPPTPATPGSWPGSTLSTILSGGSCVLFSTNNKDVTVTGAPGAPVISITGSPNNNEGNTGTTAFTFTVNRTGDLSGTSSASWAVTGSGANPANATDFSGTLPSGTVSFAATEAAQTITVNVSGDTDIESDEGFTVTLSAPVGATISTATATGTIQNDDFAPPTLAIAASDANKAEGNTGTTPFTFTVNRTGDLSGTSSASWAVTGSGANPADAADFSGTLPSGTVSFAATEAAQTITVNVSGDTDVEPDEGFTVTLSNPVNSTITTATATGTIQNDDAPPSYCTAGATNTGFEKISNVQFNTINNSSSSTAGYEDFTAVSTSVAKGSTHSFTGAISSPFPADEIIVWIDFNQDLDFEDTGEEVYNSPNGVGPHTGNITIPGTAMTGNTRMRVRLHDTSLGPNTTPCGTSTYGQVEDYTVNITDAVPTIAISGSPSQNEGNTGTTAFNFTVTRSGNTTGTSSASWAVTGSGANPANAADFGGALPSGTVNFAISSTTETITVNVSGDTDFENNEGFTVTLSSPVNATITTTTATGTIQNDDCQLLTWYQDSDMDNYGNPAVSTMACTQPAGYVADNTDCDDGDANEFPGQTWYLDGDGDNYSDGSSITACVRPANHYTSAELTATSGDCNDGNAAVNPGATEVCNGIDDDCDAMVDEGVTNTYYADTDADGFGDPASSTEACTQPAGYVTNNTDNCPSVYNPDQDDADLNGVGDICQSCPPNLTIYPYAPIQTTFQAQQNLMTSGAVTIPNGTSRVYKAGTSTTLNAEFEVQLGGELDVQVETCTPLTTNEGGDQ